jgi:hypothetical protein
MLWANVWELRKRKETANSELLCFVVGRRKIRDCWTWECAFELAEREMSDLDSSTCLDLPQKRVTEFSDIEKLSDEKNVADEAKEPERGQGSDSAV